MHGIQRLLAGCALVALSGSPPAEILGSPCKNHVVVGGAHLQKEKLHAELIHVFRLVFVLREPGKSEFTHRRPDTLDEGLEITSMG